MQKRLSKQERNRRRVFGQNFLIDEGILESLTADIGCSRQDRVVEIGPGNGALTRHLLKCCSHITAVEVDPKWVEHLKKKKEFSSVQIIQADAGKLPVEEYNGGAESTVNKPILIGNLPYNKAGPILRHLVPVIGHFKFVYVMVQYEVAKRITAIPHKREFGALSVFVQNYASCELRLKIPPQAFRPKPRVFSATVKLKSLQAPYMDDPMFMQFIQQAFSQKRKTLVNSLRQKCKKAAVLSSLDSLKIPATSRAEDLSVEQFACLFRLLRNEFAA